MKIGQGETTTAPTQPEGTASLPGAYIALTNSLKSQLEQFRGKAFKRNIAVSVLTQNQNLTTVANQLNSLTPNTKQTFNKIWICENMLHANQDYFAGYDSMMSSIVGGFYRNGSDSITIVVANNATSISSTDTLSIFHELVHAMQDQYYHLSLLQSNVTSSDQNNALDYVEEGEAELFTLCYSYKMFFGEFPTSLTPVMDKCAQLQLLVDQKLDSLHGAGEPLLRNQPMMWAYYSYDPLFIAAVTQGNWSIIDNQIFVYIPIKQQFFCKLTD